MSHTYAINSTILNSSTAGGGSRMSTLPASGTYTIVGGGSGGQFYTTTSNGTATWANQTQQTQFNGGNGKPVMSMPHGKDEVVLEKDATLDVKGTVKINGIDLEERLNTIEKVLQIPERDVKLEAKHPKLKELYDAYIHALGKYRTWDAIKGKDND